MPDILHDFPVKASPEEVFQAIATPEGLDAWWSLRSSGRPAPGQEYRLDFGPDHQWTARVTRCTPGAVFELELTEADADWTGTRVGFALTPGEGCTEVNFHHLGWPRSNQHYRISCFCWAMYLRLLKKYVEEGVTVPYERRLEA